ncbi:uncharacterized protein mtg isoform X1 [Epargyreus clarus]|uniref:uncharacterized protein mtg isoform X1 n=1 Tax=Epargyreus clarus TaxID=520877 RepID=UPI003C30C1B3
MKPMGYLFGGFVLLLTLLTDTVKPLCVLESDFGFKINCAFKKAGLFRVRNLGGIKAHASVGFSLGDELGFEQSLTNLDTSRRRSVNLKNGAPNVIVDSSTRPAVKQEKRGKQNRIMMRPMAPVARPNPAAMSKLSSLHRQGTSTMKPIIVPGPTVEAPSTFSRIQPTVTMAKPMPMGVPPFRPLPPKEDTLRVVPIASSPKYSPLQVPQSKGPGLAYTSEHNPFVSHDNVSKMVSQMTAVQYQPQRMRFTPTPIIVNTPRIYTVSTTMNPFVPMPIASPPQAISIIPAPAFKEMYTPPYTNSVSQNTMSFHKTNPLSNFVDPVPHQVHDLASMYPTYNTKKVDDFNSISGYGDDTTLKFNKEDINAKIAEIAKAGNISMEAVEAAIALRQQQLLSKYANIPVPTTSTTTTSTTTEAPPVVFEIDPEPVVAAPVPQKPKRNPTTGKVMNAPREYYPVGYEKNFDDHFQSKVDLPDTAFHCGDQKYFPGLYGDESLGCMVFHVCALTDDGLVMKSFLCPESTLFDQTILKCNWWFYVDCKNTVKLYDTNIPVSKSYQLMKALTFFSSYKKEMEDGQPMNPEDVEGIKEAITILENQDRSPAQQKTEQLQIVTPQPVIIDERNNHKAEYTNITSPVYRGNRDYTNSTSRRNVRRNPPQKSIEAQGSEFRLVTVNADLNFNNNATKESKPTDDSKETSAETSTEKRYRRRMVLKNNGNSSTSKSSSITTTTTTTAKPVQAPSPLVEIVKQEIPPIEYFGPSDAKQETLTDGIENLEKIDSSILKEAESLAPVRRFYRSSAERGTSKEEKEIEMINNEQVQIVRPTNKAQLVGEFPTPSAVIAKLDEAVLGRSTSRVKKQTIAIVTPHRHETYRSPTNRERT